ncbi:MAG: TIGR00266 family protein [Lentilactobacillus hilgardii]|uniref:TIGR00266 family protein n=2 Tax=Lentilactobacillus hilgardii TaxID=1588 RepID=UPI001CC1E15D|nr:TIGR00266 family protein [Lentilactobacillus hilgardii]MBZ2201817.1 TIGR00266 family protein [Lentilactobacillus hilgardii]MBZ2204734.1 TIGR00266 family protein [Lentilactobacillus hilgardii]
MDFTISKDTAFPTVTLKLRKGEQIQIERGSMIAHNDQVTLEGHMNSNGKKGFGGVLSALGRSVTSGEGFFITTATGNTDDGELLIAPANPGAIRELRTDESHQWRLNTSAYLASDEGTSYKMIRQKLGSAVFGGTGGLFVMETQGSGTFLVSGYADIMSVELHGNDEYVVDNSNVVAWSQSLDYNIEVGSGTFGFKTGEGLVNHFKGTGTVLIQTRSIEGLANLLMPFLPDRSNDN